MIGPATSAWLAETRRRPGRLLLTGLAILVATVFAAGALLFSEALRGYVAARTQQTPAAAAVVLPDRLPRDELVAESASGSVSAVLIGVGVFAGLATVAAALIVASTYRIVLTRRRTQIALLRCVGARRGQVVRAVLAEAAVCGLVAGVLGVGLAVLGGYGLLGALWLSGVEDVPELVVPWPGMAGCLLLAVVVTLLAALAPALAASRDPRVAGRSGDTDHGPRLMRHV
jgi:FtsX-like permease family protein